jgi:hypothetical protein
MATFGIIGHQMHNWEWNFTNEVNETQISFPLLLHIFSLFLPVHWKVNELKLLGKYMRDTLFSFWLQCIISSTFH